MRTGINHLCIPGPTNVPEPVRRAVNVPMEDHRAPDFGDVTASLFGDLATVYGNSTGRVLIHPGSGTGAWESAISNTLNRGDRVLMARHGHFSHLWADMATRLGLDVVLCEAEWGSAVPVDDFKRRLADDKTIKAVFVTHNETSTGVTSDVAAVRAAMDETGSQALLYVDGVSSIGSIDFRQDEWGVDLAVSGSQKGFMLPPGLGFLSVSEKALAASRENTMERYFFAFADMIAANDTGYFPFTPPTPLLRGLRAALDLLFDEGLANVYARHHRLAEGVRRGVDALGLRQGALDPAIASDTVTAIRTPEGIDSTDVVKIGYHKFNTSFGGGLSQVAGKIFRIGHLGDCNEVMCLAALSSAEMSLRLAGADVELGAGVAAAQAYYVEQSG